jgi:5-methylcytosine-specific restriction endonuclease McrA
VSRRVGGRRWRRLIPYVIARDGGVCQIRLPGCQGRATTADHVIPVMVAPEREMDPTNLRAACIPCNLRRGTRTVDRLGPLPSPRWLS